jgi:hypothetical protein
MQTKDKAVHTFQVIRHRGQPTKLQLPDGTWVYKQDKFWIPEWGGFVNACSYDDHFLYEIPARLAKLYPGSPYRCSCGGAVIFSGPSGYVWGASPQGRLALCMVHSNTGLHATGGSRWV